MPTLNYPLEEEKYKAKVVFGLVKREKVGEMRLLSFLIVKLLTKEIREIHLSQMQKHLEN